MRDYLHTRFGDYRILQEIGAGGMGQVFLAENIHHHKQYALKILPEDLGADINFRKRFFDEARVMSELDHPRIVRVHHVGEYQGTYYLVMDYVTGPEGRPWSLYDELRLHPEGRARPEDAIRWTTQIAESIAYAHKKGVIHRDIKPANILMTADRNVKITDFGLAKAIGSEFILHQIHQTVAPPRGGRRAGDTRGSSARAEDSLDLAETLDGSPLRRKSGSSSILGTYDYMSPELRDGKDATAQSDIYSLGVLAYRISTGRRPVGMTRPPSAIARGYSKKWDTITAKCLADNVAERYPNAEILLHDLRRIGRRSRLRIVLTVGLVLLVGALSLAAWTYGPLITAKLGIPKAPSAAQGWLRPASPHEPETKPEPNQPPTVVTRDAPVETTKAEKPVAPTLVAPTPGEHPPEQEARPTEKPAVTKETEAPAQTPPENKTVAPDPEKSSVPPGNDEPPSAATGKDQGKKDGDKKEVETPPGANELTTPRTPVETRPASYPDDLAVEIADPRAGKAARLELRLIKAGGLWFQMGIPRGEKNRTLRADDPAQRPVSLSSDFYIGRYEVTQRQYQAVMGGNPSLFQDDPQNDPNRPVERVSWDQANQFCTALGKRADLRFLLPNGSECPSLGIRAFCLPTEDQWEYACRAQDGKKENLSANWPEYLDFCNGNLRDKSLAAVCWYSELNSGAKTHPVGRLKPNAFDLYDLHGNVWEWCRDEYRDAAAGKPGSTKHVLRGGAYISSPWECRSGWRTGGAEPRPDLGFRVVLEVE